MLTHFNKLNIKKDIWNIKLIQLFHKIKKTRITNYLCLHKILFKLNVA